MLLEWADALLVCGRLTDARAALRAPRPPQIGPPIRRPGRRAALGLGGVWLNELRGQRRAPAACSTCQRPALAELPADSAALRGRLGVRLGAEAVYDGAADSR